MPLSTAAIAGTGRPARAAGIRRSRAVAPSSWF